MKWLKLRPCDVGPYPCIGTNVSPLNPQNGCCAIGLLKGRLSAVNLFFSFLKCNTEGLTFHISTFPKIYILITLIVNTYCIYCLKPEKWYLLHLFSPSIMIIEKSLILNKTIHFILLIKLSIDSFYVYYYDNINSNNNKILCKLNCVVF